MPGNERRPSQKTGATETFGGVLASIAPTTLRHPKAVAPGWAVMVMRRDGKWRRQVFLSLHSATKAMERAAENGVEAKCMLIELVPVPASPVVVVEGGAA